MTALEKLELRLGIREPTEEETDLLTYMLELAEESFLSYTNRKEVPETAENLIVEMAAVKYHTNDALGEASRSEGAISVTFVTGEAYPKETLSKLNAYRVLKAVHCNED